MERHSLKTEVELAKRLRSLSDALTKFRVYRHILGEPEFITMLDRGDGEAYQIIMKAFRENNFNRASQLILEARKSQIKRSYTDFKSLYFDSIIKSICDGLNNLKLEEFIGHSLADILIRLNYDGITSFDGVSDTESKNEKMKTSNHERRLFSENSDSEECFEKPTLDKTSRLPDYDLGALFLFLQITETKIFRGIYHDPVTVDVEIVYDHVKVISLAVKLGGPKLTYKRIRAQVEHQLDFAFVFIASNTESLQLKIDLILDENHEIPIIKGKYGYEAKLPIARFIPTMPSNNFDQYLEQLKRSDLYSVCFITSDKTEPAYFVSMKQFNSKPILDSYAKIIKSIYQDFICNVFLDMIESKFKQKLDSKNDYCLDLKKTLEVISAGQNSLLMIEPKKSDTEKLLESYSLSLNQIIMGNPEQIFLRSKRADSHSTPFDPSIYPATLTLRHNIEYEKIIVWNSKSQCASIDGNQQTTYDIVYERHVQINDD